VKTHSLRSSVRGLVQCNGVYHDPNILKRVAYRVRALPRTVAHCAITLRTDPIEPWEAGRITNYSELGACIETSATLRRNEFVLLQVGRRESLLAIVRWSQGGKSGVQFARKLSNRMSRAISRGTSRRKSQYLGQLRMPGWLIVGGDEG
jgi:hypothetical protein